MMKYLVKKGCVINSKSTQPGDIVELNDNDAALLMAIQRIEPYDEPKELQDRSVGLGDEKPKRRTRKIKAGV